MYFDLSVFKVYFFSTHLSMRFLDLDVKYMTDKSINFKFDENLSTLTIHLKG